MKSVDEVDGGGAIRVRPLLASHLATAGVWVKEETNEVSFRFCDNGSGGGAVLPGWGGPEGQGRGLKPTHRWHSGIGCPRHPPRGCCGKLGSATGALPSVPPVFPSDLEQQPGRVGMGGDAGPWIADIRFARCLHAAAKYPCARAGRGGTRAPERELEFGVPSDRAGTSAARAKYLIEGIVLRVRMDGEAGGIGQMVVVVVVVAKVDSRVATQRRSLRTQSGCTYC